MDITIERLNGESYVLSECGIKTLDFVINSPSPRTEIEVVSGRHGFIDLGTVYDGRSMAGQFMMDSEEIEQYARKRNDVFQIFDSRESFYLIDSRESNKRWLVKVAGSYSHEQIRVFGMFSVNFISASAFAESVTSTLNMILADITHGRTIKYKHTTARFEIYNGGVKVDPRSMPLVITYKGSSTNLKIKNLTTNEEWAMPGIYQNVFTLKLDGVRATKDGLSVFRQSNKKLITLAPGWNEFEVSGASGSFEISFDFRFHTL